MQFHAKTQIRLVAAVTIHGFGIRHAAQRRLNFLTFDFFNHFRHQPFHQAHDIVFIHKRHFQINLRVFGLAVGAQVFIAKTARELEITVIAGHHQKLLK